MNVPQPSLWDYRLVESRLPSTEGAGLWSFVPPGHFGMMTLVYMGAVTCIILGDAGVNKLRKKVAMGLRCG